MVPTIIRWSGLAAVGAGVIFAGIQPVHPADVVASVSTPEWAVITTLKTAMCFLFLAGIAGIYARQTSKAGWLGVAGLIIFSLSWWLQTAYVFAETFIFPVLANTAPQFVDGMLAYISNRPGDIKIDLGALPGLYSLLGLFYMLGGMLFGVATFRANILPRPAAGLMALTALLTPLAALLPHQIQRFAAVPMGLAVAWLGVALLIERRANASENLAVTGTGSGSGSTPLTQTAGEASN
ncbi:MAG: hypothetical protein BGO39_09405 [Chloroflexi bacterium 54-19]|nr:MAG: hypothetical protein BGO39_09405 [Chloroflexi bacterium 54-19]